MKADPILDWDDIRQVEPKLGAILAEVMAIYDPGAGSFCAEELWHNKLKQRIMRYVGFYARSENPRMKLPETYEFVCDTIRDALPPCRKCACLEK
jgi:hypothetical protein